MIPTDSIVRIRWDEGYMEALENARNEYISNVANMFSTGTANTEDEMAGNINATPPSGYG